MKHKKVFGIVITCFVSLIAAITIKICYNNILQNDIKIEEKDTSLYKDYQIIKDNDVNLLLYGDIIDKTKYVDFNEIDTLNNLTFKAKFNVIIINDFSNNNAITDEDYNKLNEYITTNNILLIYYGKSKLQMFYEKFTMTKPIEGSCGVILGNNIDALLMGTESDYTSNFRLEEQICSLVVSDYIKLYVKE